MKLWPRTSLALAAAALLVGPACSSTGSVAGGAAPPDASAPADGGGPTPTCTGERAAGVEVRDEGLLGFPPYAADGCSLAYVAVDGSLRVRDLATGAEETVAAASERPRRPALGGGTLTWEAGPAGGSAVFVRALGAAAENVQIASNRFALAGEPRAARGVVVFTAWASPDVRSDSDVWLYELSSRSLTRLTDGPAQQRFADVSDTHVAWTDFSEDPDGRFDENDADVADVVVHDRATGRSTTRALPGKQAFPILASGSILAYLDWAAIHPEPKLTLFGIRAGALGGDPRADRDVAVVRSQSAAVRPAGRAGVVEWVDNPAGTLRWFRADLERGGEPALLDGSGDAELYAPAVASGFAVVARKARDGSGKLGRPLLHASSRR